MQERRRTARTRVFKGAQLIVLDRHTVVDCTVRDLSAGGACLEFFSPFGIPQFFDLSFEFISLVQALRGAMAVAQQDRSSIQTNVSIKAEHQERELAHGLLPGNGAEHERVAECSSPSPFIR